MQFSRGFLLALLAGIAVSSVIAGYLLNKRRRRYRSVRNSIISGKSSLERSFTFQTETSCGIDRKNISDSGDEAEFVEAAEHFQQLIELELPLNTIRRSSLAPSDSSSDSFHSIVDELLSPPFPSSHQLYHTGLQHAVQGQVIARTLRTQELDCSGDIDFLAKLYCVRLAFDELTADPENRQYFQDMGRNVMSNFLSATGHNPSLFKERFDGLVKLISHHDGWRMAESELKQRRVVVMNVYDVALDFVLLDAFSDLENPPSTVMAVLQNTWLTDGMKKSALSTAVWSLLKAKRSMLHNKDGFMGQFYLLSEVITPVMVWGFLGTDQNIQQHCLQLKGLITGFLKNVFSLQSVRYSDVGSLADDILQFAKLTSNRINSST